MKINLFRISFWLTAVVLVVTIITIGIIAAKFFSSQSTITTLSSASPANTAGISNIQEIKTDPSSSSSPSWTIAALLGISKKSTKTISDYPEIIYGTAFQGNMTQQYVELAIKAGYRAFDTAGQPRSYNEKGVGDALVNMYSKRIISREEIFLQSKFTPSQYQFPADAPYGKKIPFPDKVFQSVENSLSLLQTSYLDLYLLHYPATNLVDTMLYWKAMEELVDKGIVKQIGLGNAPHIGYVRYMYANARIKPTVIQNRYYDINQFDDAIIQFCHENKMKYESIWTISANRHVIDGDAVTAIATKYKKTPEQVFYHFIEVLGIIPLTDNVQSSDEMKQLLGTLSMELEHSEYQIIYDELNANHGDPDVTTRGRQD